MKNYHLYDRWVSMNLINRKQILNINLSECIDEFGNSFGKEGNHFFIKVLNYNPDIKKAKEYLKNYYKENVILSVDQILKKKAVNEIGKNYYCPWEENRVRPLLKFKNSHKIGPTPEEAIDKIIARLFNLLLKIQKEGFSQFFRLNGYPRCFELKVKNKSSIYVCRDGQHRLAILSYLGYKKIKVCYESDFWEQSKFLNYLTSFKKVESNKSFPAHLKIVNPHNATDWPHVKLNHINKDDAVKFFYKKFKLKNIDNE